jgi:hypothetical protein
MTEIVQIYDLLLTIQTIMKHTYLQIHVSNTEDRLGTRSDYNVGYKP